MAGKRILITGVSSGLGKALAQEALEQGCVVIGTVRQEEARRQFEASAPGRAYGRLLDVRQTEAMPGLVSELESSVGPLDAFVNNAGNGLLSTIEEAPLDQVREQFEVNVFGCLAMLQAVLPGMRQRRAGRILNVTSMGGLLTFPSVGIYNATKFAMEGITEALRQEVGEFGIHVTAIEPGVFKTDWSGRSQQHGPESIRDYDGLRTRRASQEINWNGDPVKAAKAMLTILDEPNPPGHLLLGSVAGDLVEAKLNTLREEFARFHDLTYAADLDGSSPGLLRQD